MPYANVGKSAPPSAEVHNIGHNYHGHYSHAGGLSVKNYVHENNVRGIYVREYQSLVEISLISVRGFGTTVGGFMVDYRLKISIYNEICDSESITPTVKKI